MRETTNHHICRALDERIRLVGLTPDEFVPIALIFVVSFITGLFIYGMVLMALVFFAFRKIKSKKGQPWALWVFAYRHSTRGVAHAVFPDAVSPTIAYWW